VLAFLAGAHDLGKATPAFQELDPDAGAGSVALLGPARSQAGPHQHAQLTQLSIPEALAAIGFTMPDSGPLSGTLGAGCALGGHHGTFALATDTEVFEREDLPIVAPGLGPESWTSIRACLVEELAQLLGVTSTALCGSAPKWTLFAGLTVVSDWLASSTAVIRGPQDWCDWRAEGWHGHVEALRDRRESVIGAAGLRPVRFRRHMSFPQTFAFGPNELQASLDAHLNSRSRPAFVAITAPMGIGKTEAALRAAQLLGGGDRGVFFALPTMATADAMFDRVVDHARHTAEGDVEAAVWHGYAALNEAYLGLPAPGTQVSDASTQVVASSWLRGRRRTLLSSVAAGTVDQLLSAVLPARFSFLRWYGLSQKTVIIDEAHSLTPYMHRLLETAVCWLGALGVPVIVLSATMPRHVTESLARAWSRGAELEEPDFKLEYPGWVHVDADGVTTQRVPMTDTTLTVDHLHIDRWGDDDSLSAALEVALNGVDTEGCGLVVANTVADAQRIHRILTPWADAHDVELTCLHSRMRMRDRRRTTDKLIDRLGRPGSRPRRFVLVSTQVVEQSLDVDFDIVVSALAPTASLLQRAGRAHRHSRDRTGLPSKLQTWRLIVLVPVDDGDLDLPQGWRYVYPVAHLRSTLTRLAAGPLSVPGDVQDIIEDVYAHLADPETDPDVRQLLDATFIERQAAASTCIQVPDEVVDLGQLTAGWDEGYATTRLGARSTPVLLVDRHGDTVQWDGGVLPERPTPEQLRSLLDDTIPVPTTAALLAFGETTSGLRPTTWPDHALLRDLVVAPVDADGTVSIGTKSWRLDDETGWGPC
jgi:CRISPR-associated endonuclease/helicase Cas3